MARSACIMMQKNEILLLEPWIVYHSLLFGIENCFVFDNGSDLAICKDVLIRYERLGLNVERGYNSPSDFSAKGQIFTQRIQELQQEGKYDFYFPLDCDEFVLVFGPDGLSGNRQVVHSYLDSCVAHKRSMNVSTQLINIPGRLDRFAVTDFSKSIAPAAGLVGMDHGFHTIQMADGRPALKTKVVYAHLHNKPFDFIVESARSKLAPFVNINDMAALKDFAGVGNHLLRYLFGNPEVYHQSYANTKRLNYAGLSDFLSTFRQYELLRIWNMGDAPEYASYKEPNVVFDATHAETDPDVITDLNIFLRAI